MTALRRLCLEQFEVQQTACVRVGIYTGSGAVEAPGPCVLTLPFPVTNVSTSPSSVIECMHICVMDGQLFAPFVGVGVERGVHAVNYMRVCKFAHANV